MRQGEFVQPVEGQKLGPLFTSPFQTTSLCVSASEMFMVLGWHAGGLEPRRTPDKGKGFGTRQKGEELAMLHTTFTRLVQPRSKAIAATR